MQRDELQELLGAGPPGGTVPVMFFLPSADRSGTPIDVDDWRQRSLATFGHLFRGATALPPGRGVWRNDDDGGDLLFEDTTVIFALVPDELVDDEGTFAELGRFLRSFGRDANQGEVGVIVGAYYHPITQFSENP